MQWFKKIGLVVLVAAAAIFAAAPDAGAVLSDLSAVGLAEAETHVGGYQLVDTASRLAETSQVPESQQAIGFVRYDTASECSVAAKNTPITDPARLLTRGSDVRNATGNITSEILDDATIFYRAHGGDSGPIGRFLSPSKPLSSAQAISGGALPPGNTAQNVSTLRVQGGVRIQRSTASDAFGQIGGDPQVELLERANITIIKTEPLR